MPVALTFRGTVDSDGRPSQSLRERVRDALKLYREGEVEITVRPPRRSTSANAYYWAVVVREVQRAMVDAGQIAPTEAVHDWLKRRHLPGARTVEVFGESITLPASTAILDSTEFADYVERIRTDELLLSSGCVIPEPDAPVRGHVIAEAA